MSFFSEIRRRKVFQVAAVYAVVAWLIIQIVDVVSTPLSLPAWFATAVIVLLAIGFPIAVILAWAFDVTPQGIESTLDTASSGVPGHPSGQGLNYITHALVLLAVGFLVVDQYLLDQPGSSATATASSERPQRFTIGLGRTEPQAGLGSYLSAQVALSRDGMTLAYVVKQDARGQLYIRPLDQLEATAVSDSMEATPFFSPDGETLAFSSPPGLKKIAVRGGPALTLGAVNGVRSGFWGDDGLIVFCARGGDTSRSLFEVPASGGTGDALSVPRQAQGLFCEPSILPGGNDVLFTAVYDPGSTDSRPVVAVFSRETGETRTLVPGGFGARYIESTGHLVFARAGVLWAMPFDPVGLTPSGPEVPLIEGVQTNTGDGRAAYAISDTGTLVYVRGDELVGGAARSLVWVDRYGAEQPALDDEQPFLHARVSPIDQRVALVIENNGNRDIWIYDLERGSSMPLTFDAADDETPLWTPDGQRIVFSSTRDGGGIFSKAADGSGPIERLTTASYPQFPEAFSPDGMLLVYREEFRASDLHVLSIEDLSTQELLATEIDEDYSAISPNGRWFAIEEDQEVYVRPFPNVTDTKWRISRGGGNEPLWHPNGNELFYRQDDGGPVMAVAVLEADPDLPRFSTGPPQLLFEALSTDSEPTYSLSPDGENFLIVKSAEYSAQQAQDTELVIVINWFEELKRLAPRTLNESR